MASKHVVKEEKTNENSTIFSIFNKLIKSKLKNEKTCAALIDFLMVSEENVGSASAVEYSAKRLVRGLASAESDKQNVFFAALATGLLKGVLSANIVVQALKNLIENSGNSKSEQSTKQITTVLAYGAIVTSGKVSELCSEELTILLQKLVSTANSKTHLKTAAALFFCELISNLKKKVVKSNVVPVFNQELKVGVEKLENEFFAVIALAFFKFPKQLLVIIDTRFGGRNKFFEDICERLFYVPLPMQEMILVLLCQEFTATLATGKAFMKLFKSFVEKDHKINPKRNAYILLFLKIVLDVMPFSELISKLLQPKVLDALLKSLQAHDKKAKTDVCYIRAKQVLEKLIARITDKSNEVNLAFSILKLIFSHPSGLQFDKRTKSNFVQSLILHLNTNEVVHLADDFIPKILDGFRSGSEASKNVKDIESLLILLVKLVSNILTKKDSKAVPKYIKNIFDMAFQKSLNCNAVLRAKATESFFKCLELSHIKIEDAAEILNEIALYAEQNMAKLEVQLKDAEMKQWKSMMAANTKLSSKSDKKFAAVRLLLLHMGLLMFRDPSMASSTIEELLQCYERIKNRKKVAAEEEPDWVEVTIDLLLAMLSRENKLLRHVVSSVFPGIVPHLTPTAVQQIVDALDPASRNDVLKHVDSDDSDDEGGEEEESDDDEEESEGSDVEGEEETVNDKLRMAVRNALGYSAALTDDESVDMDEMNEEEESRLNESLASAFSLFRAGKKKKQTKDDEALMHFRIRVLDLVEIVISTSPTLSCCLELLNPLFALLENSIKDVYQKPLHNRLDAVLKKLGGVKKFADETDVSYSDLVGAMKGLFERETSGLIYVEMATALTESCSMIIRGSQLVSKNSNEATLEDILNNLLNRYFKLNDRKVPYSIFQVSLRMMWDGNWTLSKNIMNLLLDNDLKLFKKFKLIELLDLFYKNDRLQSSATDDCKKAACAFESKFVKKFTKNLLEYEERKNCKLLPTFYGRLISLVPLAIQASARFGAKTSPWAAVVSHLLSNIHHLTQQKSRNKLMHLAQQCGIPLPDKSALRVKPQKRAAVVADSEEEDGDVQLKKKKTSEVTNGEVEKVKKQKNNAEVKKLKQESRDLREAAFSQGLADVNFSSINVESLGETHSDSFTSKKSKEPQQETNAAKKKSKMLEAPSSKKKKLK